MLKQGNPLFTALFNFGIYDVMHHWVTMVEAE